MCIMCMPGSDGSNPTGDSPDCDDWGEEVACCQEHPQQGEAAQYD